MKRFYHSRKWKRAVAHIKASGTKGNPYAIATATLGKKKSLIRRKHRA